MQTVIYSDMILQTAIGPEPGLAKAVQAAIKASSVGRGQIRFLASEIADIVDKVADSAEDNEDAKVERTKVLSMLQCTNLACTTVSTLWKPVKSRSCSKCKVARYCCRACQVADWGKHKLVCGVLAEERT